MVIFCQFKQHHTQQPRPGVAAAQQVQDLGGSSLPSRAGRGQQYDTVDDFDVRRQRRSEQFAQGDEVLIKE
jgi:hypothetical protein